jgi:hypothetical protein
MEPDIEADREVLAEKPSGATAEVHCGRTPIARSGFPIE